MENKVKRLEQIMTLARQAGERSAHGEAIRLWGDAERLCAEVHGEGSEQMAEICENLGGACSLFAYDESVRAYEKALSILRRLGQGDSPRVPSMLNTLGVQYGSLGKFDLQVKCYEEAIEIGGRVLGRDHEIVRMAEQNLTGARAQGGARAEEANDLEARLNELVRDRGVGSLEEADLCEQIGDRLGLIQEYLRAAEYYTRSFRIRLEQSGGSDPATVDAARLLGAMLGFAGVEAFEGGLGSPASVFQERALGVLLRSEIPPRDGQQLDFGQCLYNLGGLYLELKDADRAVACLEKALAAWSACFDRDHSAVCMCLRQLGEALLQRHDLDRALEHFREALARDLHREGEKSADVAEDHTGVAKALDLKGQHAQAIQSLTKAFAIQKAALGEVHPKVADTCETMAEVYTKLKDSARAEMCRKKANSIRAGLGS